MEEEDGTAAKVRMVMFQVVFLYWLSRSPLGLAGASRGLLFWGSHLAPGADDNRECLSY